jgi:hypothetical protein
MKLMAVLLWVMGGIMFLSVCLPALKQAYLSACGVPTQGTIEQRYSMVSHGRGGRHYSYYLVVQYETPSGWQSQRIPASKNYYGRTLQGKSVPIHYLAQIPSQVVLDGNQLYGLGQVLLIVTVGIAMLGLPYYIYRKMRAIAENGMAVKGLIIETHRRLNNQYLTVYYEFQEAPYQGTITLRANQVKADWQPGKAITLLVAPDPPSSPGRPHTATPYPALEFKINP